jgi:hypothetical protein
MPFIDEGRDEAISNGYTVETSSPLTPRHDRMHTLVPQSGMVKDKDKAKKNGETMPDFLEISSADPMAINTVKSKKSSGRFRQWYR